MSSNQALVRLPLMQRDRRPCRRAQHGRLHHRLSRLADRSLRQRALGGVEASPRASHPLPARRERGAGGRLDPRHAVAALLRPRPNMTASSRSGTPRTSASTARSKCCARAISKARRRHGGVLVVGADDVGGKSTVTATSSDPVWRAALMPILYPSNTQEYLDYGLLRLGLVALRRRVDGLQGRHRHDRAHRDGRRRSRAFDASSCRRISRCRRAASTRSRAISRRCRSNAAWSSTSCRPRSPLPGPTASNKVIFDGERRGLGIVTAGKPYLDVREALTRARTSTRRARARSGIRLYKLGMIFPLEPDGMTAFARGHREAAGGRGEERLRRGSAHLVPLSPCRPISGPRSLGKKDEQRRAA